MGAQRGILYAVPQSADIDEIGDRKIAKVPDVTKLVYFLTWL